MLCNPFVNPLNRRQPWVTLLPTPRIPRWINLCHRSYPLHETPFLLLLILSKNRYPTGAVSCGSATNPWVGREREECISTWRWKTRGREKKGNRERKKRDTEAALVNGLKGYREPVDGRRAERQLGGGQSFRRGPRGGERRTARERWIIGSRDQREPPLRRCRPVPFSLNLS